MKIYQIQYWPELEDDKELCPNIWRMEEVEKLEQPEGVVSHLRDSGYNWYQVELCNNTDIEAFITGYNLIQEKINNCR